MSEWQFLRSRRWAGYLGLAIVFAIVCSLLGAWQFARRDEAQAEIARIDANYDATPRPLAEVLPTYKSFNISQRWQQVSLTGKYLSSEEVTVRNRPFNGGVGFEIVTPFLLKSGAVFFVDRGWVGPATDGSPGNRRPAPDGEVTITARLKAGEGTIGGRKNIGSDFATIDLDALAERVHAPSYTGAFGLLVAETSTPPLVLPRPERDEGPHLSYALQWFVFAIMGFVGLGWLARQERNDNREDAAKTSTGFAAQSMLTKPAGQPKANDTAPKIITSHPGAQTQRRKPARSAVIRREPRKSDSDSELEDGIVDAGTATKG